MVRKRNRFEGLIDDPWKVLEGMLPEKPEKRGKGKPPTPWQKVYNSFLWIIKITTLSR